MTVTGNRGGHVIDKRGKQKIQSERASEQEQAQDWDQMDRKSFWQCAKPVNLCLCLSRRFCDHVTSTVSRSERCATPCTALRTPALDAVTFKCPMGRVALGEGP